MQRFFAYFKKPFPVGAGFSAYRFPGFIVHLPVISTGGVLGLMIMSGSPALWPLIAVYLLVGVYLGRDLAIFCHYAPLGTVICLGAALTLLVCMRQIMTAGAAVRVHLGLTSETAAVAVTLVVAVLFVRHAIRHG